MVNRENQLLQRVLDDAVSSFAQDRQLAERAIAQLSDKQLHQTVHPGTNSVSIIMKHMAGNLLSRWTDFLTTDGEKPWRHRDQEFEDSFGSRQELLEYWESGWNRLFATLRELQPDDLGKTVTIRGERYSVPRAINRSMAHCAYHVGQILMLARILCGDDWQYLTIPPGQSEQFNQHFWKNDDS